MPLKLMMQKNDTVLIHADHLGEGVTVKVTEVGNPRFPDAQAKSVQLELSAPQWIKFDASIKKMAEKEDAKWNR